MKAIHLFLFFVVLFVSVPNKVGAEVLLAHGIESLEPEIRKYLENRAIEEDEKKAVPYVSEIVRGDINGDAAYCGHVQALVMSGVLYWVTQFISQHLPETFQVEP